MAGRTGAVTITAAHIAVAVVAACGLTGADAATVFEDRRGHVKTRLIAAAGLMARLNLPPRDAARLLQIDRKRLSPSMLGPAGATTEALLTVAEALEAHGLAARPPVEAGREEVPAAAPQPRAQASSKSRKAATSAPAAKRADPPPAAPKPGAVERRSRPVASGRTARPAAPPNPVRATDRPARPVRLKPVTARVATWCRAYVARGVPVEDLAELFDVHPDALRDHLNPQLARAA